MAITQLSVCNDTLLSLGQETITAIDDTNDPQAVKLNSIWANRLKYLLSARVDPRGNGWAFARKRLELTRLHKLTVDTAPTAAAWAVGATLTGADSAVTCTVKKVESSLIYWVTEPSGDFTDGEIISDGTNSVDCAADYPEIDETPPSFGSYNYAFGIPSDYLTNLVLQDQYNDTITYPFRREGYVLYANITEAYARYTMDLTDVTIMPGWFTNLISKDLADRLAPKFVGNDQYVTLRAKKNLDEAWMDALSGNGGDTYFETAGRETEGNTDSYEGFRTNYDI